MKNMEEERKKFSYFLDLLEATITTSVDIRAERAREAKNIPKYSSVFGRTL